MYWSPVLAMGGGDGEVPGGNVLPVGILGPEKGGKTGGGELAPEQHFEGLPQKESPEFASLSHVCVGVGVGVGVQGRGHGNRRR